MISEEKREKACALLEDAGKKILLSSMLGGAVAGAGLGLVVGGVVASLPGAAIGLSLGFVAGALVGAALFFLLVGLPIMGVVKILDG